MEVCSIVLAEHFSRNPTNCQNSWQRSGRQKRTPANFHFAGCRWQRACIFGMVTILSEKHGAGAPCMFACVCTRVCTAANRRRYLGQLESNGYCYSLFRKLPTKLTRVCVCVCSALEDAGNFNDIAPRTYHLSLLSRRRGTLPAREFQTEPRRVASFDSPPSSGIQSENGLADRVASRPIGHGIANRIITSRTALSPRCICASLVRN